MTEKTSLSTALNKSHLAFPYAIGSHLALMLCFCHRNGHLSRRLYLSRSLLCTFATRFKISSRNCALNKQSVVFPQAILLPVSVAALFASALVTLLDASIRPDLYWAVSPFLLPATLSPDRALNEFSLAFSAGHSPPDRRNCSVRHSDGHLFQHCEDAGTSQRYWPIPHQREPDSEPGVVHGRCCLPRGL
jgi:hypothetical protein